MWIHRWGVSLKYQYINRFIVCQGCIIKSPPSISPLYMCSLFYYFLLISLLNEYFFSYKFVLNDIMQTCFVWIRILKTCLVSFLGDSDWLKFFKNWSSYCTKTLNTNSLPKLTVYKKIKTGSDLIIWRLKSSIYKNGTV